MSKQKRFEEIVFRLGVDVEHEDTQYDEATGVLQWRRADGSLGVGHINLEPTMAQQQFAEECDINNIIKRHGGSMDLLRPSPGAGIYADLTEVNDFHASLEKVRRANEAFMMLNADVRKRFENDPAKMLAFLQNDANYEEALQLGLVERKKPDHLAEINANIKNATIQPKKSGKVAPPPSDPADE